jgi:hypothetical protein
MSKQRSLLAGGLSLTLRNWPALVWTYIFNLVLSIVFSLPLYGQINAITGHSFGSQRLTGAFDLGVLGGLATKLGEGPGSSASTSYFSTYIYLAIYFLLVPGTLFCYQTGAPAKLSTMLQTGIAYFWRFVRITLISLVAFGIVLGILFAIQGRWASYLDEHTVGRAGFIQQMLGIVLIGFVAAALRVYFDLVEVYTVQLGLLTPLDDTPAQAKLHRQIRKVLRPAWQTFRRNFFRVYETFVLLFLLGVSAVIITARIAMHSLAQPRVWPLFLLAQIGLFLMLLTRFWQRGAETVLALDNALLAPVLLLVPVEPEPLPELEVGPGWNEDNERL